MDFKTVSEYIKSQDCKLLASNEEYEKILKDMPTKARKRDCKLKILSKCGHESTIIFHNFRMRGTGIYCKSCANFQKIDKLKTKERRF